MKTTLIKKCWVACCLIISCALSAIPVHGYSAPLHTLFSERVDYLYVELPRLKSLKIPEKDKSKSKNNARYEEEVTRVLEQHVDLRRVSRGIMGEFYRQSSPAQKEKFYLKVRDDLIRYSVTGLQKVDFKKMIKPEVVTPKEPVAKKNVVTLNFFGRSGRKYPLLISLSKKKEKVQITNISVGGLNLGVMLRHQFTASMMLSGGNIDKVIAEWKPITL